jgi:hypothetical protein
LQDLSHTVPGLSGHASMCGSNMVSVQPDGSLPGSTSEATEGVKLGNPELDIPDTYRPPNRPVHADRDTSAGHAWTTVQGVGDRG